MKKQNLILLTVLVLCTLLFTLGCSNTADQDASNNYPKPYRLYIINQSDASISQIGHEETNGGAGGAINADGSLIARNEVFEFNFDDAVKATAITILDENKDVLLTKIIPLEFNSEKEATFEIISNENALDLVSTIKP